MGNVRRKGKKNGSIDPIPISTSDECCDRTLRLAGNARDLPIAHGNDFFAPTDDFQSGELFTYQINDWTITIRNGHAKLDCSMTVKPAKGDSYKSTLNGSGACFKNTIFLIYDGFIFIDPKNPFKWKGVMTLKILSNGSVRGYWMAEELIHHNVFAFGDIQGTAY
ncbi:MAG: hypothetical protein HQL55_18450 [Magnetococcales bacterium]|nr:hypothetical protein [Magnetococcales bacterium]